MATSKAQQRATNKYVKENYDRIEYKAPKGKKAIIKAHAEARGESVNAFIGRAVQEAIDRDFERSEHDDRPVEEIPNAETLEAFAELDRGGGTLYTGETAEIFAALEAELEGSSNA